MAKSASDELLRQCLGWIGKRCRKFAKSRPGLDWEELQGAAITYFLEKVAEGKLEQVPPGAQVKWTCSVLDNGAKQAVTDWNRDRLRRGSLSGPTDDDGDELERPIEELVGAGPEALPIAGLERKEAEARGPKLAAYARKLRSPVRRLVVIAVYLPGQLTKADVEAAAANRVGGSNYPVLKADVVWKWLEQNRATAEAGSSSWREALAFVFGSKQSPDGASSKEKTRVMHLLDQHASRGREQLREMLIADGVTVEGWS